MLCLLSQMQCAHLNFSVYLKTTHEGASFRQIGPFSCFQWQVRTSPLISCQINSDEGELREWSFGLTGTSVCADP